MKRKKFFPNECMTYPNILAFTSTLNSHTFSSDNIVFLSTFEEVNVKTTQITSIPASSQQVLPEERVQAGMVYLAP